jgi:hypothetical protein
MGYNYLQDNKSKFGLHHYDQALNGSCSDVSGQIHVHHNVVVNQKGAGITFQGGEPDTANDSDPGICWTTDFLAEYNLLVNVGLGPPDENGISSAGIVFQDNGMSGIMTIRNNILYGWSDADAVGGDVGIGMSANADGYMTFNITNNIFYSDLDVLTHNFSASQIASNITATNNVWYYSGSNPARWVTPSWDSAPITIDPSLLFSGVVITNDGLNSKTEKTSGTPDIYGTIRDSAFIGSGVE